MDTWIYLSQGFAVAMTPENLVIALIGCFVGTIVGLLPGLGPINGVAILLPLAFALDWARPPRHMNSTSYFYNHSSQWRYEKVTAQELLSPLADASKYSGHLIQQSGYIFRMNNDSI